MKRTLAVILPLILLSLTVLPQAACTPNELALVKSGGRTIERLIDSGISFVPGFVNSGQITPADGDTVLAILGDGKKVIREFNTALTSFTSFPASKKYLATLFKEVSAALARLNAEGVTRIKDPVLRGKVQIGLTAINLAASEIEALLSDSTQPSARDLRRLVDQIEASAADIEDAFRAALPSD